MEPKTLALIAAGGAASAAVIYAAVSPTFTPRAFLMQPSGSQSVMQLKEDIIDSNANPINPRNRGTRFHPLPAPEGAKRVPIVGLVRTTISQDPSTPYIYGRAFRGAFEYLKAAMREAGRGDEDARAVLFLHALETGWFRCCYNWNLGNRKVRPHCDPAMIREGYVYTTNQNTDCVYILRDQARSIDFYPGYVSLASGLREEKAFFERYPAYHGVIDAYRRGGVEGCIEASAIMQRAGYSPRDPAREAEIRGYWRRCGGGRLEDWVR